jgi:hypothetical protein
MDSKKKEKEKALINTIIAQRKKSAKTISNILYNILDKDISRKKIIFIKRLIIARKDSAIKIQSIFRAFLVYKTIHYYINKIRTCFLIKSSFRQNFKNLQIIVFLNYQTKIYDLNYDKFFNKYIFFMDRSLVNNETYKVQFISEGRIIIDSLYDTIEEEGVYYNLIDFNKIRKQEDKNLRKRMTEIKSGCSFLSKKGLWIIHKNALNSTTIEEESEESKVKSFDSYDKLNLGGSMKFETPTKKKIRSSARLQNLGSSFALHKKKNSFLKGILKIRSSNERRLTNTGMKVKFGDIEFSY